MFASAYFINTLISENCDFGGIFWASQKGRFAINICKKMRQDVMKYEQALEKKLSDVEKAWFYGHDDRSQFL